MCGVTRTFGSDHRVNLQWERIKADERAEAASTRRRVR
jgi:hypothetical protein